jgi:hypothetical protein
MILLRLFTYGSRGKGPEQIQDLCVYMFVPQAVPPTGHVSKVLNGFRTSVCTCLYHTHFHFFFVTFNVYFVSCLLLCCYGRLLPTAFIHPHSISHLYLQFAVAQLNRLTIQSGDSRRHNGLFYLILPKIILHCNIEPNSIRLRTFHSFIIFHQAQLASSLTILFTFLFSYPPIH